MFFIFIFELALTIEMQSSPRKHEKDQDQVYSIRPLNFNHIDLYQCDVSETCSNVAVLYNDVL